MHSTFRTSCWDKMTSPDPVLVPIRRAIAVSVGGLALETVHNYWIWLARVVTERGMQTDERRNLVETSLSPMTTAHAATPFKRHWSGRDIWLKARSASTTLSAR